ncbi:hypothetical protein ABT369_40665 [Dactylosporangium sp. NPDC000244]|uniref:hypothetical protein n=1 Tax=Dactylosporangium sp. NPDC000244 TaxID=3154365 RepID=UPI0033319B17
MLVRAGARRLRAAVRQAAPGFGLGFGGGFGLRFGGGSALRFGGGSALRFGGGFGLGLGAASAAVRRCEVRLLAQA